MTLTSSPSRVYVFLSAWRRFCAALGLATGVCSLSAVVTGQWDFEQGDLRATVGAPLQYRGSTGAGTQFGTTASFGIPSIGGQAANVMRFPAASAADGFIMPHGASPNGGGTMVNRYSLVLDVLYPSSSTGFRAILQTDAGNTTDADLFVNGSGGIGISSLYHGNLSPGAWHRVAFTVDLTKRELGKYINGTNVLSAPVGEAPLGTNKVQYLSTGSGNVDQRWALGPAALLFSDEANETAVGYVNSIQFHDRVLTPEEISALGSPGNAGIPEPTNNTYATVAQYDFNGDLKPSGIGLALETGSASPASTPDVTFSTATIAGQTAQVASFTRGTFFRMTHGLAANGGGTFVNRYTFLMDVMLPSRPTGWAALWQTSPGNANDADWFVNPSGGVGISSVYGGNVVDGAWNRLALVVDATAGTLTSYVNGEQTQSLSGIPFDGRWSLDTVALLFADEDQENTGGYVNSVQLRPTAMAADEIAALGGATAAGIPAPVNPSELVLVSPNGGEVLNAGSAHTISWTAKNSAGYLQVDLLLGGAVYRTLGQALMRQSNFVWNIDPAIGDTNNYTIRIQSLETPTLSDSSDATFSISGSGTPPNFAFGQPLQANGGFESSLDSWQVIQGNPVALTATQGKGVPASGTRFLHGGLNPGGEMVLRQEIDLLAAGFTASDLDAGSAVDAEAWLRNAYSIGSFDDQVYFRVGLLDASRQELTSVRTLIAGDSAWQKRVANGILPAGTRYLRLEVVGRHRRDKDNDSMADDIAVRIQRSWPMVSPQITKKPMLQDYRTDTMTLFWETDGNLALHSVDWGRADVSENTFKRVETLMIDSTHYVHRAVIGGLSPETTYLYRVRSGETTSAIYSFKVAPNPETPFRVAWWADSQDTPSVLQTLIPHMISRGVDWMGVSGDLASNGRSLSDWHNYWFTPMAHQGLSQNRPAFFSRGNHDGEGPLSYAYSMLPDNEAWYAFSYGNSRFIFLDTEASTSALPEQYQWLTNELARPETQNAAFRVVSFHKPPWCNLWNGGGYTGEGWVRNDWVPLFERFNVDVVLNGHAHNYNRGVSNGVTYLIVGGGGGWLDTEVVATWPLFTVQHSLHHFGLMSINGYTMDWEAIRDTGATIDSFALSSRIPRLGWVQPPGQTMPLVLKGKPGVTYVTERSENLKSWTAVSTNMIPAGGPNALTNAVQVSGPATFFRSRVQ